MLIATVEKEHNDSSARKLSAELAEIQRSVANERIVITTVNSTMEVRNRAAKQGMTTGKLLQIQKKQNRLRPHPPSRIKRKRKSERKNPLRRTRRKGKVERRNLLSRTKKSNRTERRNPLSRIKRKGE